MRRLITIILLLTGGRSIYCQEIKNKEIPEKILETILEYAEITAQEGTDLESLAEELAEVYGSLFNSPLNINKATREQLERLFILNDFQIESVIDYRNDYGALLSINELYQIAGFDNKIVDLLSPFIYVDPNETTRKINLSSLWSDGKSQVLLRGRRVLEEQLGYTPVPKAEFEQNPNSRYLGAPGQFYTQLKYEHTDKIKATATFERDAGEKGIDYKSFNISLYKAGRIEKLVLGDYNVRFGQGLVIWNSFSINSYSEPRTFRKSESGANPYNSTDENISFRGIATTIDFKKVKLTLMGSHRTYDSRVVDGYYTSLLNTGLHNTTTTLDRKHNLTGSMVGSNLKFSSNKFKISQTIVIYKYNLPYGGRDSIRLAKDKLFMGYGGNMGVDFYWVLNKFRFFGESALDHGASFGGLIGLLYSPYYRLETALLFKYYSKNYYAPFAVAESRGGTTNDEMGIKGSFAYRIGKYWRLSSTMEILKEYHYASLSCNYTKESGVTHYFKLLQSQKRASLRYNINYPVVKGVQFANRLDITSSWDGKLSFGYHFFTEIIYKSNSRKFDASFRVTSFDTPLWDLRIYSYERDLLYGFSLPVFYGKGYRWYFNFHLCPWRSIDLWLKISQTRYTDRQETGEGLDLITGPSKSELKLQLRWRF
jgi:hypothetical protein